MAAGLSSCAYYQQVGDGKCSYGCWQEPRCITDEPLEGWAIESNHWWVRLYAKLRYRARKTIVRRRRKKN